MPELNVLVGWIMSGSGRMVGAAVVFFLLWGLKSIPWVNESLLTTPRRKQAAALILSLAPAAILLADPSVPWHEVIATAIGLALSAMGYNALRPSKTGSGPGDP